MSWSLKLVGKTSGVLTVIFTALTGALAAEPTCPKGTSALLGSLNFGSTLEWNLLDPRADLEYFFIEDPTVNEGALDESGQFLLIAQQICLDTGTCDQMQEAFISGFHLVPGVFFVQNCPATLTNRRGVFIFSDSQGTVAVSVDAGEGIQWDLDTAAPADAPESPAFLALGIPGVRVLTKTRELTPIIVAVSLGSVVTVGINWDAPRVLTDAPIDPLTGTYSAFYISLPSGTEPTGEEAFQSLTDTDGNLTNTQAVVALPYPAEGQDFRMIVRFNIDNSEGRSITGGPSAPLRADPTLSTPGRGKKLGHEKAPGLNR